MVHCPNCASYNVMADGELRGVCNVCGFAWDYRKTEDAPTDEDGDYRYRHQAECSGDYGYCDLHGYH